MMYPRLDCLETSSDDGVIFVSIDDNEQSQTAADPWMRYSGWRSRLATFVWKRRVHPSGMRSDACKFQSTHEYVLLYAKNPLKVCGSMAW